MTEQRSFTTATSNRQKRLAYQKRSVVRMSIPLLALVLLALVAGIVSAEPPSPPLVTKPFLPIGPTFDFGPSRIAARQRALSKDFRRVSPESQDPFDIVDACVEEEMVWLDVPGAAIAIAVDGQLVYERGYGVKHREQGGEVDSNTIFRIGSTTKMMTAAAVMQQVDQGRVDLQAPVTDYVPEFQVAAPWNASDMTVWNLLTHSTGFPDRVFITDMDGPQTETALTEWAGDQSEVRLYAPPGSFWNYSNPNFTLAGLVAERASGVPYHEYMHNNVWATAGMTRTTLLPAEVLEYGNYTYGHWFDPFTGEPVVYAPDAYDNWWVAPAGLAFSTPGDLVKWALLLMDGGGDVLSPESAAAMQDKQMWQNYTPTMYYGYGIFADEFWGVETRDHAGNVPGWGSTLLWVPERDFAVSVLGNTFYSMYSSLYCATQIVLGLEPQPSPDYSTEPHTWDRYTGTYNVLDYTVLDPAGLEYEAVVTREDEDLRLTFPFSDPFNPTVPFSRILFQALLDTFLFDIDLDGAPDFDITFINDPDTPGQVKWMRSRIFVGTRVPIPQGTDSLTASVFSDYQCDSWLTPGVDIPLEDMPVTISFPDGSSETYQTGASGLATFPDLDASGGVTVRVGLPAGYSSCPNSPTQVELGPEDFDAGQGSVQFAIVPTELPPDTMGVTVQANPAGTGFVSNKDILGNTFGGAPLYAGVDTRGRWPVRYHGAFQFDLSAVPADAYVVAGQVELTGLIDRYLGELVNGTWDLWLLDDTVDTTWTSLGYWHISQADAPAKVGDTLTEVDLGVGAVNTFDFSPSEVALLADRLATTGKVSFRMDSTVDRAGRRHIFGWDGGRGATGVGSAPVLRITYVVPQ